MDLSHSRLVLATTYGVYTICILDTKLSCIEEANELESGIHIIILLAGLHVSTSVSNTTLTYKAVLVLYKLYATKTPSVGYELNLE